MDTKTIDTIMHTILNCSGGDSEQFRGVFPIDRLNSIGLISPGNLRICIINSQTSTEPGEHWLVVGFDLRNPKNNHAFIFDSLSRNPKASYPILAQFLKENSSRINFVLRNKTKFQTSELDSCGLHAIYFVAMMTVRNLTFREALQTFDPENTLFNDCTLLHNINEFLRCSSKYKLLDFMSKQLLDTKDKCESSHSK